MTKTIGGGRRGRGAGSTVKRRLLELDGEKVLVISKRIKNVYLRVKPPEGRLEVTAPVGLSDKQLEEFVRARRVWIGRTRGRISNSISEIASDSNDTADDRKADGESRCGNEPQGKDRSEDRARRIIEERLPRLVETWVPVVGKRPTSITLRHMKTRWGSCTPSTGRIRLNTELAWLDLELLEYVFVHELTHLHAHGHGPLFQELMTRYMPDWRQRRKRLNQYVVI